MSEVLNTQIFKAFKRIVFRLSGNFVSQMVYRLRSDELWNYLFEPKYSNFDFQCHLLSHRQLNWGIVHIYFVLSFVYNIIHRGYYTVARRYEFYVRVTRTISHK